MRTVELDLSYAPAGKIVKPEIEFRRILGPLDPFRMKAIQRPKCQQDEMIMRTALVTGASSGIGLATAVALANAGFTTVATLRDTSRADALLNAAAEAGVDVEVRTLDVTDQTSITTCVQGVVDTYGRLDVLVNNAGAASVGTVELQSDESLRAAFEVNFFGVVAMTRAAMPHLRATSGRLVTVSSVGGVIGQPFNEAYCAAKFAVEGFMESLAPVAAAVGVAVSVVEPGAVASAFVANAGLDRDAMLKNAGPYVDALDKYLTRTATQFDPAATQSPSGVAEVISRLVQQLEPSFRVQTSSVAREFVRPKLVDLDGSAVLSSTAKWVT